MKIHPKQHELICKYKYKLLIYMFIAIEMSDANHGMHRFFGINNWTDLGEAEWELTHGELNDLLTAFGGQAGGSYS